MRKKSSPQKFTYPFGIYSKRSLAVYTVLLVLLGVLTAGAQSISQNPAADVISQRKNLKAVQFASASASQAPTDEFCRANFGIPWYSPQQIRTAYGLAPLLDAGFVGRGQTIVIIDSFGSPTIAQDLHNFDVGYGLPDPPSLTVLAPLGTVPFDPTDGGQIGWAIEATLDVEWAHAMAPGADIVLLTSPVNETEGVQGMPEFLELEKYALDHHLGKIISQSWGTPENDLLTPAGLGVIKSFEEFYFRAASEGVTVLAATGDTGSTNFELDGATLFSFPVVVFPASSPLVTAVGGTSLLADTNGNYQSETVWNNGGASGGGISQVFEEPFYQFGLPKSDQALLKNHRGIPDVAYDADPLLVYVGFFPGHAGFFFVNGTSQSCPQWAGIIADTNQLAGHSMGLLNPKLYLVGLLGEQSDFFHDITVGNNSFNNVSGFNATPGWDPATGWGSPNLGKLVQELAKH